MKSHLSKEDFENINNLVKDGFIRRRTHSVYSDVNLYNYSDKTQYSRNWNEYTIACRGLIVKDDGEIVGRPFPKFFNYDEVENIPWDSNFKIYPKLDGSLIIVSGGGKYIASRGSFESEQVEWAKQIIQKEKYVFDNRYTYLFELIHPENRIIVNYGDKVALILLAVIETSTGIEKDIKDFSDYFHIVDIFETNIKNENDLLKLNYENEEGFVILFENGLRIKIKFETYKRLHRLRSNLSTSSILENLKNSKDVFQGIPDEFYPFIQEQVNILTEIFNANEQKAKEVYLNVKDLESRKEIAIKMNELSVEPHIKSAVFSMLDGKDYKHSLWSYIEKNKDLLINEARYEDV